MALTFAKLVSDQQRVPTLYLGFGTDKSSGDKVVADLRSAIDRLSPHLQGGNLILISGPCTVASAFMLSKILASKYDIIAVEDPKMQEYQLKRFIVAVSQGPGSQVGDVIEVRDDSADYEIGATPILE